MNVWQWAASAVAMGTGIYGAWRSWRTDRKLRATEAKWEITHFDNWAYLLTSRLPYTAKHVRLELPAELLNGNVKITDETIAPTESVKFIAMRPWTAAGDHVMVTWHHFRTHTVKLVLPPKP